MMDGIQQTETGQDDGIHLWNEHVAMVEETAENFLSGRHPGDFSFRQVNTHAVEIKVPLEQNLLEFLIHFYATVFTPRLAGSDAAISSEDSQWSVFANGLQCFLFDLVGVACSMRFLFSPFEPGTTTIRWPLEAMKICVDFFSDKMNMAISFPPEQKIEVDEQLSESVSSFTIAQDVMELDTATSRKRRRKTAPLDVS